MRTVLLTALLFFSLCSVAQFTPKEGTALNSRLIGISLPFANSGVLEIAKGIYDNADSFKANVIMSRKWTGKRMIVEVPAFGTDYTWRIYGGKTALFHHFSTLDYENGSTRSRLRIISNSGKYNTYVFVDKLMTLYDMQGEPVWFIPAIPFANAREGGVRDMKLTPQGTVTFIMGHDIREIDDEGNLLWQGPNTGIVSGDTGFYHHEFTRLANGNYMVLGTEHVAWPLPLYHAATTDSGAGILKGADGVFRQWLEFGTIIEYDRGGNVVWSWKSSGYFKNSEIFDHYRPDGTLPTIDVHENAFYFDEKKKEIYAGFKNISRIVKIKYPEGKVTAVYGEKNTQGALVVCNHDFCGEHSIRLSRSGELILFNNNSSSLFNLPQVVVLQEKNDTELMKKWSYSCTLDGISEKDIDAVNNKNERIQKAYPPEKVQYLSMQTSPGGNVIDLPNRSYFVSMGGSLGKMFIVNEQKEILWSAVPELKIFDGMPWTTQGTYRAAIIDADDLQKFIWHSK